jgi:serine/threonine protein kinase
MLSKISRFNIIRVLGEGSQGIVYLAQDPILERHVAIKALRTDKAENPEKLNALLMDEAKVISKMTHSNIVAIYEAGEETGRPFLVFEYVKGRTLADVIKSKEYQSITEILSLFKPICLGMLHSHQNHIIHGDLKPANIVVDEGGIPKIMDFGIANLLSSQKSGDGLYGTPRYMPPEYLQNRKVSEANDVYALGLILYEMLTAEVAIPGNDIKTIISNVIHHEIALPFKFIDEVGELFEHIVLKASDKDVNNRFNSINELLGAVEDYESRSQYGGINSSSKSQHAAITFLIRKIKRKQDFPALSKTLFKINTLVEQEDTNSIQLANVIIEDFALTNKILKLVNSAYYRTTAIEVKTVSQAVLILGFDEIRSVAISLILIDHLHNKTKAKKLKNHIVSSIYSGILAKNLSVEVNLKVHEEAFLTGTFHQLGEMLALYYFHEEAEEIEKLINDEDLSKEQAAIKILGVSYQNLGVAIAKQWKLPQYIINNIPHYKPRKDEKNKLTHFELNDYDKLKQITSLSNDLSDALEDKDNDNWRHSAVGIWKQYSQALDLDDNSLIKLANQARENLIDINHIFNINLEESNVLNNVKKMVDESLADDSTLIIANNTLSEDKTLKMGSEINLEKTLIDELIKPKPLAPEKILHNTFLAITKEIETTNNTYKICQLYMDSVASAFNLERMVICFYDKKTRSMNAKMGIGISDQFLQQFRFSLKPPIKNLFQVASAKGVDIYINDTNEYEKKTHLPAWYRQIIDAETFMLFPIAYKEKPFALFYLDKNKSNDLVIGQEHIKKLHALKSLCIKSIEKR